MQIIRNRAELKQELAQKNVRHKIDENILVDKDILKMIRRKQKPQKRRTEVSPSPIKFTSRTPRKNLTPQRRQIRKISSTLPSNCFNKTFQNSLLNIQDKKQSFSMFNNNYNRKVLDEYQSNFSYTGQMKSPYGKGQPPKQNLTTLAKFFNPKSSKKR